MRTPEEIAKLIKKDGESYGVWEHVLIEYLPYDLAYPYLADWVGKDDWDPCPLDANSIKTRLQYYVDLVRERHWNKKDDNHRYIMIRLGVYLWLLGEDELLDKYRKAKWRPNGNAKIRILKKFIDQNPPEVRDE